MKTELYIAQRKIEINSDINYVLNRQLVDLQDLTKIVVEYSKTISVPMTPNNNAIFDFVYKFDHQVIAGQEVYNYDPSKKMPMEMHYNGRLVLEGYAVLSGINLNERKYEINIYGQLGKIFSILNSKTISAYNLNGTDHNNGLWKSVVMNNSTIARSWDNDNHSTRWTSSDWTDFFGFAPQLFGKTDSIDTKAYEDYGTDEPIKFEDEVSDARKALVQDGFDFNGYGEIRSYMTRPYVYVSSIINAVKYEIQKRPEVYDGYQLELDDQWFQDENPYWQSLVYFPAVETKVDRGKAMDGRLEWNNNEQEVINYNTYFLPSVKTSSLDGFTYTHHSTLAEVHGDGTTSFSIVFNADGIQLRHKIDGTPRYGAIFKNDYFFAHPKNNDTADIYHIDVCDAGGNELYKLMLTDDSVVTCKERKKTYEGIWALLKKNDPTILTPSSYAETTTRPESYSVLQVEQFNFGNITINSNYFRFKLSCSRVDLLSGKILYDVNEDTVIKKRVYITDPSRVLNKHKTEYFKSIQQNKEYFKPIGQMTLTTMTNRSGSYRNIVDILGSDFVPMQFLMDYAKRFRLMFDIDYETKKIVLTSRYFEGIEYRDVIVDYAQPVEISPIIDDKKSVKYGYTKNETLKGQAYLKRFDVEYGDMSVNTGIDVTENEMTLAPDKKETVFIPKSTASTIWENIKNNDSIGYFDRFTTNDVINTLDGDGKIKYAPFFCFRKENKTFERVTDPNGRQHYNSTIYISDDSPRQRNTGTFCYLSHKRDVVNYKDWFSEVQSLDEDGYEVYYLNEVGSFPTFDNWIAYEVKTTSVVRPSRAPSSDTEGNYYFDDVDPHTYYYRDPLSGQRTMKKVGRFNGFNGTLNPDSEITDPVLPGGGGGTTDLGGRVAGEDIGGGVIVDEDTGATYVRVIYWSTFGVPKEVYNGVVPERVDNYSIYNRWSGWLNELFNVNNKKLTCYIKMTYPDFINFRFNILFVIDNSIWVVNRIIDFNPNSQSPTKVELMQVNNIDDIR